MRSHSYRYVLGLILLLGLGACSSSTSGKGSSQSLAGSYQLVGDVGGTQVKPGATVTLTLKADGTLTVLAVQTGQRLTDTGTWKTSGTSITIEFKDEGIKGTGPYEYDGKTLQLPVLVFGSGKGVSQWRRSGSSPSGSPSAPPAALGNADNLWDLDHDAAAAGTKVYSEAIAKGTSRADAIAQAVAKVKAMPDVTAADLSANGLNITVTYSDGLKENIVTERLQPSTSGPKWRAGSAALGTSAGACEALPGQSADPREPGREGVNPGGGYGVQIYDQNAQPKPVTSVDSPPVKKALLIAPQYDVPHPLHGAPSTIRAVTGDNIECLQASLTKANYTVDTILGRVDSNKKLVGGGDDAIQQMVSKLTTQKYGVIYFLGHGYRERTSDAFAGIWMGAINLDRPEIKAVINGKKIDHVVAQKIIETYTTLFGFTYDAANPVFDLAPDDNRTPSIVVKPAFFAQLRTRGADFSKSLMMIDACSSAASPHMYAAAAPKAYLGWKNEMDGAFISHASEAIFDMLADKVRTVRAAAQLWQIHEKWKATGPALASAEDWINLVAVDARGKEYDKIDAQTYILIFRLRHGVTSASSDIKKSAAFIQACYDQIWKFHKGALASPACHALAYGGTQPTEGEVVDALSEVGMKVVNGGTGRWTLAD